MEDIFKPQSLTVKQLFGNTDSLYQIPRYQRAYSWSDDQLIKLWDDLVEAFNNEPNYFLGSIITAKPGENSSYLDIVDGQQRITTITILLCVYRDMFPNLNSEILDSDPFAVDHKIIESSIKFNDRFERLRLKTHSNHQSDFENLILNGNTTSYRKPYKKDLNIGEEPRFKFINCANFFYEKLSELTEKDAGLFINYLFNQVKIIRIDCQSVSFAIKLFQVLNDRGLDLSNADLIKSFLIGKIHKKYSNDEEVKKQKEDQFMDDWKVCEKTAVDTEYSINEFFVMYEYYLLESNPKKSLYDELVYLLDGSDANQTIAEFKRFCNFYKDDIYNKEDKIIYSFWYLRWSIYWRTILVTALHTGYQDYNGLCKVLLRYYYLNWIAGNTLTRIKQMSFNLIKWTKDKAELKFITEQLQNNLDSNNAINRAIDSLNGDIYYEQWVKPLFFMIEYKQTDSSNPVFLTMGDRNIHLEHILPRAYSATNEWQYFHNDQEVEDWINSGGNLTLLSGAKNISASNSGFERKIGAYSGKGFHGENEGITSFQITQKIVNDHFTSGNKNWEWEEIFRRWNWFCSQIESILEINLENIKKKPSELSSSPDQ